MSAPFFLLIDVVSPLSLYFLKSKVSMDEIEEAYYRCYLISLCQKLRCEPEQLTSLYSFCDDINRIFRKLIYEESQT